MPSMQQEIQATLDAYRDYSAKGLLASNSFLSPDAQKAWTVSTGFVPYNLQPVAVEL